MVISPIFVFVRFVWKLYVLYVCFDLVCLVFCLCFGVLEVHSRFWNGLKRMMLVQIVLMFAKLFC